MWHVLCQQLGVGPQALRLALLGAKRTRLGMSSSSTLCAQYANHAHVYLNGLFLQVTSHCMARWHACMPML